MPTETVYGLAADARNDMAVARIFAAKGRPRFNPLIVHLADAETAQRYVVWSDMAQKLADAFWPGPLTLVLPLKPDAGLSPLVTAGLPSLAVRVPAHPLARSLLQRFGGPVAAPSANPSGRISPTKARHVLDGLSGKIEAVLNGGACPVGVESTIVGLTAEPTLLRPGGVAGEQIEAVLGQPLASPAQGAPISAPGQLNSHYAPGAKVRLNVTAPRDGEILLGFGAVDCALNLSATGDLTEAAANLFGHLHALDALDPDGIAISPIPDTGLGRAINDRLRRAAAPR
ncbi:t(6)A37 threonylcarbamoyladenosine biosynthesis protein RimN [Thalassovita gelatinovora]|uniref:Threonylcarbamoyl-AMP synthase n=2 Tax=Thalassovita gelatinovora TaxID=53501 RepID=A0A0P1G648_THAGE|nr:t(6)A37 threonylcarbamoyladenosine biosynthesis protein RimN [Thalassovita gelatinovora]SEP78303.1 translation factor SUA5 [Thalassovita gelatinovora]